jgi:hypothetical protein
VAALRDIKEAAAYNEIIQSCGKYRFIHGMLANLDCPGKGKTEKKRKFKMPHRLTCRVAKICKLNFFEVLCIDYCIFAKNVYT